MWWLRLGDIEGKMICRKMLVWHRVLLVVWGGKYAQLIGEDVKKNEA